ncbi:hypothetical protein V2H45_08500 [Tumidithrix elongata RA019]|uniref:Uncharacterized protein n=1 Tax=Tumidithrix elongata BACA0141 TaxID=2716417 RepID=A0AAW9Q0Q2_9CYAN|nr:hypothetical protein [Tumidithrix elongata RA019]
MRPNEDPISEDARRKGYTQGEIDENNRQAGIQKARDSESAVSGTLIGIILAVVVGMVVGTIYFLNRRDQAPVPSPVIVPVTPINQPSPTPVPTINITIPPQQQTPPQPTQAPPNNINITVPPQPTQAPPNNINITVPPQKEPVTQPSPQGSPVPKPSTSPN